MNAVDLNCDMGEALGPWTIGDGVDEGVMPLISSANIATGFHAGDPTIMDRTVRLAAAHGVGVGAHPGFRDLHGFGRRHIAASADELVCEALYQIGALELLARRRGVAMRHVKPHGALYMHAARDAAFSRALIEALRRAVPALPIFCMGMSATYAAACAAGHPVVREFYADRDYDRTGSIVFTRRVGAPDPARIADKVALACRDGRVATVEGDVIDIAFESVCFHSDTPGALGIAGAIVRALKAEDIDIVPAGRATQEV